MAFTQSPSVSNNPKIPTYSNYLIFAAMYVTYVLFDRLTENIHFFSVSFGTSDKCKIFASLYASAMSGHVVMTFMHPWPITDKHYHSNIQTFIVKDLHGAR